MKSKLENYNFFYEIVKNESFSKAAEKLFVSQSSVSQALSRLENDLGVTLIERTTKKMNLTSAGKLLFKEVEKSILAIKQAEDEIDDIINLRSGSLRIAVNDTILRYFLMPKINEFIDTNKNINLKIINRPSKSSLEALDSGKVDIAVINKTPETSYEDYIIITEFEYRDILITSAKQKNNKTLSLDDIKDGKLIVLEKHTTNRKLLDAEFLKNGLIFSPRLELTSVDLIFDFVTNALGIGVVPDYASRFYTNIKEVKTDLTLPKRVAAVLVRKNSPLPVAAKSFIQLLQK